MPVRSLSDIENSIAAFASEPAGGLVVSSDSFTTAVAQTIARFGHLDILVVNAGILIRGTVDMYDLADFDRMGTVRPRAFAVLRLIANSYLIGACTGFGRLFRRVGVGQSDRRTVRGKPSRYRRANTPRASQDKCDPID
jgi:NAD(P)-dependent dehydrogenase (short-subunit alcohol dehydrogenase family)